MSTDERLRRAASDLLTDVRDTVDRAAALDRVVGRRPSRRPLWLAVAAAMLVAALMTAIIAPGGGGGEEVATETSTAPSTTAPDDGADPDGELAGPTDAQASRLLPVTVTPATGLAPGDTVAVAGDGFIPGEQVGVVMCTADALASGAGSQGCDLSAVGSATSDTDGHVEATTVVRRTITTPRSGLVDCAAGEVACGIAVGQVTDYDVSGLAEIAFDPLPAPATPTLAVTPSTGLRHDQVVALAGTGYSGPLWGAQLCATELEGTSDPIDEGGRPCTEVALVDPGDRTGLVPDGGAFTVEVALTRYLQGAGPDVVDCAVAACVLSLQDADGRAPDPVALAFDPDEPAPARPTISATPTTGLRPGDEVTVTIEGLAPGTSIDVAGCGVAAAGGGTIADEGCSPVLPLAGGVADDAGQVVLVVVAPDAAGRGVDCTRPGACGLTVSDPSGDPTVVPEEPVVIVYA